MPAKNKAAKPILNNKKATVEVLSSQVAFSGPLFRIVHEEVREPGNRLSHRDVIRHNGSVVILAIDDSSRKDPLVIMERQYRHAAGQYLWEVPAGKMDEGEDRLAAAKRELKEETGYSAKRWTKLVRYFASPGFLGEWMQVFVAEGLIPGEAEPEEDELIEIVRVPLSELVQMIEAGKILDGKTLISVMLYMRLCEKKKKKR